MFPTKITDRVVSRHVAAEALDEKTKVLLLKLRKGADATLSIGKLTTVLTKLLGGWTVDPIVGLVAEHGYGARKEDEPNLLAEDDKEFAERKYKQLEENSVSALPTHPVAGKQYVMNLEKLHSWKGWDGKVLTYGAKYHSWMGANGLRYTSPEGKTFDLLPGKYDLKRDRGVKDLRTYNVLPWIKKETSYYDQINAKLGMEEHVPAAARTRDNTGTCAACFRNIKLAPTGLMALHGYERPGHGYIHGRCVGGNHRPYELSAEGTELMLQGTRNMLASVQKRLAALQAGPEKVESTNWRNEVLVHPKGTPEYTRHVEHQIDEAERLIKHLEYDVRIYEYLIKDWKVRELPTEGTRVPNYYEMAARKALK
jgi:hypothetical protein